jgi:hypothetical protein
MNHTHYTQARSGARDYSGPSFITPYALIRIADYHPHQQRRIWSRIARALRCAIRPNPRLSTTRTSN